MSDRIACPFEIKAVEDGGEFSGYGSVFGNLDKGRDRVAPGAFRRSLAEHAAHGRMPKMLWSHDARRPPIGEWTKMTEDEHGLKVEGRLFMSNPFARDEVYPALKAKAIDQMSIGYDTKTESFNDKERSRTLIDVDLYEVSPVVFAMNPEARIARVKDCDPYNIRDLEAVLRDAGLSRSEAKALLADGFKSLRDAAAEHNPDEEKARNALRDAAAVDGEFIASIRAFATAINPK
jgi:HK97 family phage prohead protease